MFSSAIDILKDQVAEEDASIAMMKNKIFNMPFLNSVKYDNVVNKVYTRTIQDILEMDER